MAVINTMLEAGKWPCWENRIDEDRSVRVYKASNGYGIECTNGEEKTRLALTNEATDALKAALIAATSPNPNVMVATWIVSMEPQP